MAADEDSEWERLRAILREAVGNLPREVRFRAENAFLGFDRARALFPIDREMSSFRAITAQEEAAAALFRSLQLRSYPGADRLSLRKHPQKAAVAFFLQAIRRAVVGDHSVQMRVTLQADPPLLTVSMPIAQFATLADDLANLHVTMVDPLGGVVTKEGVDANDYFDAAVSQVAGGRSVDKLINKAANARNRLLYAHDGGIPSSQFTLDGLVQRERSAETCILLSIAILQVEHTQSLALQCLQGFLKIIDRVDAEVFT